MKLQPTNPLDKPVLDLGTFQQLLAAAYTLQQQNSRFLVKAKPVSPSTLSADSDDEEFLPIPPVPQPPLASLVASLRGMETDTRLPDPRGILKADGLKRQGLKATHAALARAVRNAASGSRNKILGRRVAQPNELFWRAATLVAMTAVLALLLFGSDRLSPLPPERALPSGMAQQPVPFRKPERIEPTPSYSNSRRIGQKRVVTDPRVMANPGPSEQSMVADEPPDTGPNPASTETTVIHSAFESEADVVAQNTVVRYGTWSAVRRPQAQKP